ncbi:MAG: ATPase [Clostridia bacterium]|nr:ATPase [Clostridia bacterium]
MAIEKMKFVMASGPLSQLNKLITALCGDGTFHPEPASSFISPTMGYAPLNEENPYTPTLSAVRELAQQFSIDLEAGKPQKGTVIDDKTKEYIDSLGARVRDAVEQNNALNEQIEECREAIEKYKHFTGLGVPLEDVFACKFISIRFGHLPKDSYLKLNKGYGDNPYILFVPASVDEKGYWGCYFSPKDKEEDVDKIFAALHFDRLHIPSAVGTTQEIVDSLEENIRIIETQKRELNEQVNEIWRKEGDRIRALYSKLQQLSTVFELRRYAVAHDNSCFFTGWIPAKGEERLREKLLRYPEFVVEIEDPEKDSTVTPPTRLKNFVAFRPFKYFVEMYGVPSYHDIDITAFVAITYTLLFGIMFGDMGQGLLLILIGLLMWKLKGMDLGKILVPCGVSSMIFGFVFGSVFGFEELLDPVYHKLGWPGKPLSVMESINTVLLVAIAIGVTLVVVAMLLNVVSCIKKKKLGSALFSENGLTGVVVYLSAASLAYTFMSHKELIPSRVAAVLLAVGLLILFNKELIAGSIDERRLQKPESLSDYLMQNLFETIEYILSYFSNTVSFLRVGAFVIVHASMMMVVFTLAGDPKSVKGIVVIILGNALVVALEGLLSGIQGLRLEFYEMFSRFYEGEGRSFRAAKLQAYLEKRTNKA